MPPISAEDSEPARPSAPMSDPPPARSGSMPNELPLHMRRDWRPPITERSLDAALWWGQTAERVARRVEGKHDALAPQVGRLSGSLDRLVAVLKWGGLIVGGVWLADTARRIFEWATTLHH